MPKNVSSTIFSLLLFFLPILCFGQLNYGNEWIKQGNDYYRIKVTQNGIYRITFNELQAAGFPVNTVNPKNIQLFKDGKEENIRIVGEQDGVFNSTDFIEFFGRKHDGKLDKELYTPQSAQPHDFHSMVSDTAIYFLTVSQNQPGKRYLNFSDIDYSIVKEEFFIHRSVAVFTEAYFRGESVTAEALTLSEYTVGEGYLGTQFGLGTTQNRSVESLGYFANGPSPLLRTVLYGRSNASSNGPFNHHIRILAAPTSNATFTQIADTTYRGFVRVDVQKQLPANTIGASNTFIRYQNINDLGAASSFNAVSHIELIYPRNFNLFNTKTFLFDFVGLKPGNKSHLEFTSVSSNNVVVFDLTNGIRIKGTATGTTFNIIVPNAGNKKELFLTDSTEFRSVLEITKRYLSFPNITSTPFDFVLVSHKSLQNSAEQYRNYRNETGFKTLLVYSDDLYDQFTFGQHHPLAIRRLAKYLLEQGNIKPEYLMLLGKGQQTDRLRNSTFYRQNLVPSVGVPPSDYLFTSGLDGTLLEPALATGRLAATTNAEVVNYLEKLKEYNQQPDSIWRKDFAFVSGGFTAFENNLFTNNIRSYSQISEGIKLGSRSLNFFKNVTSPTTNRLKETLIQTINRGIGAYVYFGHGTTVNTEIDFGTPEDLQNIGRYPIFIFHGCSNGNPFVNESMGEFYMFRKQSGPIAWLAHTSLGYTNYLGQYSRILFNVAFKNNYGNSFGKIIKETIRQFQNINDPINNSQSRMFLLQGDPAIKFYSPSKPDYYFTDNSASITTDNFNALSDSFEVQFTVQNLGLAITDSLEISVRRTLPDNSVIEYPSQKYKPILNTDTLFFTIKSSDLKTAGNNTFEIILNPKNTIEELNLLNNRIQFNVFIPSNTVLPIFPITNGTVNKNVVELIAQSSDIFNRNQIYYFEIDTVKTYNSSFKKTSGAFPAGFTATWNNGIVLELNRTYYWRVRVEDPQNPGENWQENSFTYLSTISGFSANKNQIGDADLNNIKINTSNSEIEFVDNILHVTMLTYGDAHPSTSTRTIRFDNLFPVSFNREFTGFTIMALNPVTLQRYSYPSSYNRFANTASFPFNPNIYSGQFYFDLNLAADRDSLIFYLNSIPEGFHVFGHNGRNINLINLPEELYQAFEQIGCTKIRNIPNRHPYLFFTNKGNAPGTAFELTADPNSAIPPLEQEIFAERYYNGLFDRGTLITQRIGPAINWDKAFYNFKKQPSDSVRLDIIGINNVGTENILISNLPPDSVDISGISASNFPFIRFRVNFIDAVNRTPAKFNFLRVNYTPFPEGTLDPDALFAFKAAKLDEGDSLNIKIAYKNIGTSTTDSLFASYEISTQTGKINAIAKKFAPLPAGQSIVANVSVDTRNLSGNNVFNFRIEPKNGKDLIESNNFIPIPFLVQKDIREPILDVAFDGRRIINGELISSKPDILITNTDENKFLLLNDTASIQVWIKKPNQQSFSLISYSAGELIFTPATNTNNNKVSINYRPNFSSDGMYTLRVRAKDASGNSNTQNDYQINFEVVNEAAITNFYPYPNPFSTSTRFVFTVTGSTVPENIKIQIMTISGKVVREIFKDELGQINIGNNITQFAWDGTDQFGDRLANGVYFYRVITKDSEGNAVNKRQTAADRFVEKEFGKIYIMR